MKSTTSWRALVIVNAPTANSTFCKRLQRLPKDLHSPKNSYVRIFGLHVPPCQRRLSILKTEKLHVYPIQDHSDHPSPFSISDDAPLSVQCGYHCVAKDDQNGKKPVCSKVDLSPGKENIDPELPFSGDSLRP